MRHDIFEFNATGMTHGDRAWRILFLLALIAVLIMDILYWRPA